MRVSVAMATYNGERYLREQLDSLAQQSVLPHELIVGDDGSTDKTLSILADFADRAPFPVHVTRNTRNLGFSENFFAAAMRCSGDWIAFCDQDDVWLPNKLGDCAAAVAAHPDLHQVLQRAELVNAELERSGRLFPPWRLGPGVYGANARFGFSVWPGFLQTVKAEIIRSLDFSSRPPSYFPGEERQPYDKWLCMLANALGGVCVLERPAALYRRHEQALTGAYAKKTAKQRLTEASNTGASHYSFLTEVALESAEYLDRLAGDCAEPDWRSKIRDSSEMFRTLTEIMRTRASLYSETKWSERSRSYLVLLRDGGYFGAPFIALGWKSAVKDAFRNVIPRRFD